MPTRVISQNIDLTYPQDPVSKYITKINANGITIHPETQTNNSWVQLDGNGLEIKDGSNNLLAKFKSVVQVGGSNSMHSTIDSNGFHIWDGIESTATNEIASFGSVVRIGRSDDVQLALANSILNFNYEDVNVFRMGMSTLPGLEGFISMGSSAIAQTHYNSNDNTAGVSIQASGNSSVLSAPYGNAFASRTASEGSAGLTAGDGTQYNYARVSVNNSVGYNPEILLDLYKGTTSSNTQRTYLQITAGSAMLNKTLTVGNSSETSEIDVKAVAAAGQIYIYSGGSTTGNRGLYGVNAAGTGHYFCYAGQDNTVYFKGIADDSAKLNGYASDTAATANTIARRQANGYIYATYYNTSCGAQNPADFTSYPAFIDSNGWLRKMSVAHMKTLLGLGSAAYTASTAYAAASHSHSYIPLTGGTMTSGSITFRNGGGLRSYLANGTSTAALIYVSSSNNIIFGHEDFGGDCYIHRAYTSKTGTVSTVPNIRILDNNRLVRTTHSNSSIRFKHDIKDIENDELNPHNLYNIQIKQFKYNDDIITDTSDCRYNKELAGFIAEQVYEHYPIAVDVNKKGECEEWSPQYIVPPMLALIQEQHKEIEQLKKEIQELKNR